METRIQEIKAKHNKNVSIGVIPGHFATNHSHINCYVDMTSVKNNHKMAKLAGEELASKYRSTTAIDTIICMESTDMVGAFLANELSIASTLSMNAGKDIYVLTPELNSNGQLIFRDNIQKMVWEKNILLLISSASTGKTINSLMQCVEYYSGKIVGACAIFSAVRNVNNIPIHSLFTENDFAYYRSFKPAECEMCAKKQKIDAIVNNHGYSKL